MNVIFLILPISRDDKIFVKRSFVLAEEGTFAATFQKMMGLTYVLIKKKAGAVAICLRV